MVIVVFIMVALEETLIMKYLFRMSSFKPHLEFFHALQEHQGGRETGGRSEAWWWWCSRMGGSSGRRSQLQATILEADEVRARSGTGWSSRVIRWWRHTGGEEDNPHVGDSEHPTEFVWQAGLGR